LLTFYTTTFVAKNFAGPVLVSTTTYARLICVWCWESYDANVRSQLTAGDSDQVMCAGNCTSILEPAAVDFPASRKFATYLQPNTGHGLNQHLNASGFYDVVLDFLKD
jgi:hypothetical protein